MGMGAAVLPRCIATALLAALCTNGSEWTGFSPDYAGPVVWNNLPVDIRAEPDITHFKNILKTYFFRLAFDLLG